MHPFPLAAAIRTPHSVSIRSIGRLGTSLHRQPLINPHYPSYFVTVAPSRASSRLNLFSAHISKPFLELNTPFSTERSAHLEDDQGKIIRKKKEELKDIDKDPKKEVQLEAPGAKENKTPTKMSAQPPHATLLIPGPIEFDDAVLQSMSHYRYIPYSFLIHAPSIANMSPKANRTSAPPS